MKKITRWFFKLIGKRPIDMEMVQYWMHSVAVEARVVQRNGSYQMDLQGEKYPIEGIPRARILFGHLSKLKHEIKNQIFNQPYESLEKGEPVQDVVRRIKQILHDGIRVTDTSPIAGYQYAKDESILSLLKYDLEPEKKMVPAVREIYRAWTKIGGSEMLRNTLCAIIQEDDGYRYRVQWLAEWFPWWVKLNPKKYLLLALDYMDHAEVVGDMKERIRLLKKIILLLLSDPEVERKFKALFREVNWSKVKMSKGDKFHFRGKYFKVDYGLFDY